MSCNSILLAVLVVFVATGCEEKTDYCSAEIPCEPGFVCEYETYTCIPIPDGGFLDGGKRDANKPDQGKPDTVTAKCGDSVINGTEVCDGKLLGGKSCSDLGYSGGQLSCKGDCTFDTSACYKCGDGSLNTGEQCDGADLGSQTCAALSFDGGKLICKKDCTFDTSGCHKCGDSAINGNEQCDGSLLGSETCSKQGFFGGALACKTDCTFDKSKCTNCGNSKLDSGEICDGAQLGGKTCVTQGFDTGSLKCSSTCSFDTALCKHYSCNDGKVTGNEDCDGTNLNSKKCTDIGYTGGVLACNKNCSFNESGCYKCGDNAINPGETCDGTALSGQTCKTKGFDGGTLKCKLGCGAFDTSGCYKCGDGTINGSEQCDGTKLGGKTCSTQGFYGGTLKCKNDCTFDTSGCTNCGNGTINAGEACDGSALGSKTCSTQGFDFGNLKCNSSCVLETGDCHTLTWAKANIGMHSFPMGAQPSDPCKGTWPNETLHNVDLGFGYDIMTTEVTQGQYKALLGYNPSLFPACGATCPVENVNWHEAAAFCNALSTAKGKTKCYTCTGTGASVNCSLAVAYDPTIQFCPGYRLPTDAEWEYAYRAVTLTPLYNGNITNCTADVNASKIAWYSPNSANKTHPVGKKAANAFGIYDMAGNVSEWVNDWFQANLGTGPAVDPVGPFAPIDSNNYKVVRNGSWINSSAYMRASHRDALTDTLKGNDLGFRCVVTTGLP